MRTWIGMMLAAVSLTAAAEPFDAHTIYLAAVPRPLPDGKEFVFVWRGDIWRAPTGGGTATQLTRHPAADHWPCVSPDGREIAFVSKRDESWLLYVMPVGGGTPVQITQHTEGCTPLCWFPDGQALLVRASRDQSGSNPSRFFKVYRDGTRTEELLFDDYGGEADLAPDGRRLLFTREGSDLYRRGYEGAQASQIWLYDCAARTFKQVLARPGDCRNPLWRPDGRGFYYVGPHAGVANLRYHDLESGADEPLTRFTDAPVILPGLARDGRTLVFRQGFDFHALDPRKPQAVRRLALTAPTDLPRETERRRWYTNVWNNNTDGSIDWLDDGLQMCFTAGGDLWVMDTVLRDPRPVTSGSGLHETEAVFAPGGKSILFLRDSGDAVNLWRAERADAGRPWWMNRAFNLTPLTQDTLARYNLSVSPTGSNLAWCVAQGELCVGDLNGSNAVCVARSVGAPGYDWSPDGKWLVCDLADSNGNRDIWIVAADGKRPPYNLSRHPDTDNNPVWSPDGRIIAFVGSRYDGSVDIYHVYLRLEDDQATQRDRSLEKALKQMEPPRKPAAGAAAAAAPSNTAARVVIDFDNLAERVRRIDIKEATPRRLFWSFDSQCVAFEATLGGKRGTYKVVFPEPLTPEFMTDKVGTQARWVRKDNRILWLVDRVPAHYTATFPFKAFQQTNLADYQRLAFRQVWRTLRDRFYDAALNGLDWDAVRRKYEDAAAAAPDRDTFDRTVSMLLGELNASHMGFEDTDDSRREWGTEWKSRNWTVRTGHLGLRFDRTRPGPGLVVQATLRGGPADRPQSRIAPGEALLRINATPVGPATDLTPLLTGAFPRDDELVVRGTNGVERTVVLHTLGYKEARDLLRDEELQRNREQVERLSGGTLGYLHIERMQWDNLRKFEQEVFARGVGREGLVIDVRDNPGGFIADRLLAILCHPMHALTIPRGGEPSYPVSYLDKYVWEKPIVVLCNQHTASNGEIFCHAIKTLQRGALVGAPTAGAVIATPSTAILDMGTLRVPERGWFVKGTGQDMELNGCLPDHVVWPLPGEIPAGHDRQLAKAVEVLLENVRAAHAQPAPALIRASERRKQP